MKRSMRLACSFCAMTVAVLATDQAHAQSVDYGDLQELFGEPITTNATGTPQRASEVAANMTIITADEIRQSGARDIPTVLSRVPGLDVMQSGAQDWSVGVRGYQQPFQPRLLVLIDGRQVFIDDFSRMDWGNLPINIDDIRQIEVVKGASSALFGSNATGGVINIITYNPAYDHSNVASVTMGTQNELTADATATVPLENIGGIKISAGGLNMNEFDTPRISGEVTNEVTHPYHRYVAQSSVFKVNNDFEVNTAASYSQQDNEQAVFNYMLYPIQTVSYSVGGGFNWQTPYGLIKNTSYLNHYFVDVNNLGGLHATNDLVVSQLEDQVKLDQDNTFRAMMEYRYKMVKTQDVGGTQPAEYPVMQENSCAMSGTWLYQVTDKLAVTNALRLDHNMLEMGGIFLPNNIYTPAAYDQAYNTISANSGLVYKPTDLDTFRATYGRGIQDPSEINVAFNNVLTIAPGIYYDNLGNPNLKPTIVDNYELGYDRKLPDLFSVARFSVYYEINRDLVGVAPTGSLGSNSYGYIIEDINVGDSEGWGGEVELQGRDPSGFRWDGSYSYQTIRDADLVETTLGYAKSAPEHHLRLLLGYTTGKWEFDAAGQYVSSTDMLRFNGGTGQSNQDTASYATLNGRIGYRLSDQATIAASVFNINHSQLNANAYPAVERQAMLTLTGRF